jgi:TonB-like protein
MKNLLLFTAIGAAFLVVSTNVHSQSLIKLPKAINPKDGYISGGTVNVRVTVNENGDVTDAEFVSGPGPVCGWVSRPDVLRTRESAVELARHAKFTAATSGGAAVASSTVLAIEFVVPKPKPQKTPKDEKYTVIGDSNYSAYPAGEKPSGDPTPKADANEKAAPKQTLTMTPDSGANPMSSDLKTISGGVLNGKAIALPKPKYPAAARAVRASGAVQVQVLIDEDGNVFSADAIGGHPLLQFASVTAACGSKFTPTLLAGQPVKVSGIIVYNFVP